MKFHLDYLWKKRKRIKQNIFSTAVAVDFSKLENKNEKVNGKEMKCTPLNNQGIKLVRKFT
jgi:hypothetical protein